MSIFENKETRKLFEAESYTEREMKAFWRDRHIDSRRQENISYYINDGKISLINKR